ncbi:hypothetical protein LSAJ18_120298 [Latilactobacillus sakei]|nr:hypothetical protein LSAJ18_120298 [Latilactobacillus sakei]SON71344.1 protein of unknown function [Latilactobacillus sakei]
MALMIQRFYIENGDELDGKTTTQLGHETSSKSTTISQNQSVNDW